MDIQYIEWLSLFFRWFHVIAAIAWIGASFYFVWLDNSLEHPPEWKQKKGIKGDVWAFHGGGIYEVAKYKLAPESMPTTLHWFKWEAYTTWITGTILLCVVYYLRADLYLIGQDKWITTTHTGILVSLGFIFSGVVIYELLFRLFALNNDRLIGLGTILYIAMACYLSVRLFSDRAAFLHLGAMIASIMAANVYLGIMPAQRGFIAQVSTGNTPDETPMLKAKLRSFHNNYFTLPVIFCMISNHYGFLYGHTHNWLILIGIIGITAYARHYFNLKHQGVNKPIILVISSVLFFALMAASSIKMDTSTNTVTMPIEKGLSRAADTSKPAKPSSTSTIEQIAATHCAVCHSPSPTQAGFSAAPAGLMFVTEQDFLKSKPVVLNALTTRYMPLANITGMTDQERDNLIQLIHSL